MSIYKELSYEQEIEIVKGIQFSVLSPDEIVRSSVVEVTKTDTYTGSEPVASGLFDPRMGILEHNSYCRTCEQKNIFCPGHFGHIVLARPIFHPLFFENTRKLLRCICYRCARLLISPTHSSQEYSEQIRKIMLVKNLQKRWELMFKLCNNANKIKRCGDDGAPGCGAKQPSRYVKEGTLKIFADWKEAGVETIHKEFTPEDILAIFQRITESEMEVLGFNPKWNRPEWLISTVIPVPPPAVRPSIIEDNGQRREDDLTHKLCDIIKTNNQLRARIEKPNANEEHLAVITGALQYHYATFLDNQIPGLPPAQQRNGRKLKSVSDRLKKKEGRIRGNLNGKRVDQSARSVITPDPYISLDQLGVPVKIAMNLTFPEIVNKYNINEMQRLVKNGPHEWPGAKDVRKKEDGKTYTLKYGNRDKISDDLVEGDIVNRHLRDDDYVLFNRQPSLHKMSMMCHRVKVMPYQTFRLNVLVTSPYNADFDGDEMNLHAPQSIQTMSELKDFANVPYHIISPKDGKPIIEVVQDTMVGSFRLTKDNVTISDKTFANLQMVNSYFDGILPEPDNIESREYSGRQASSQIMPPGLHLTVKNRMKEEVCIKNRKHISGIIDKNVFHSMSQGIIPVIYHDYNPFEVRRYLDNLQRLVCRWLLTSGFSVGISDLVVDKTTKDTLKDIIVQMKTKAYEELQKVRNEQSENNSILNNQDYFEQNMINILNGATSSIERNGLQNVNHMTNRMINMVMSGSKGKPTNVAQMIACVGQQNVDGKRVSYGFTDRTLPHYTKYDDGPAARGFVENSFISGLTPQEMFFHAMGGREGLIDTAVKTSETGYIQRRLVKAMEDAKIYYDQTVRNAAGTIIQFMYGEDGMEGTKIEQQIIPYIDMDIIGMYSTYNITPDVSMKMFLTNSAYALYKKEPKDWFSNMKEHFDDIVKDREFLVKKIFKYQQNNKIQYPIPFSRIISNAVSRRNDVGMDILQSDILPSYILSEINSLLKSLYVINETQGTRFLHLLIRAYLSPKVIICKYHFQKETFDYIVKEIRRYFTEAIANPGEMVGIIAAQSIGEISTQLTLDSFHVSGTAAAVKATSGVPRLKELLSVSKNIKTPTLKIFLKPDISQTLNYTVDKDDKINDPLVTIAKDKVLNVLHQLEITRLVDILQSTEIYWDPPSESGSYSNIENDDEMLAVYHEFSNINPAKCRSTSPWVLRMKINKEKLKRVNLNMLDIYMKIFQTYENTLECIFSDDNDEYLFFHMRLQQDIVKDIDSEDMIAALKATEYNIVNTILLKGVNKIKKVSMRQHNHVLYNEEKQKFEKATEWVLDTDGSNLIDIMTNPNIDPYRTVTNDVYEIYNVLGIEAARNSLNNEIMEVLSESSMNPRHMSVLIDIMTCKGVLMSIDRHGINRGDVGPLAKSSFEETTDMLIKASMFSDVDRINGVSANIMLGQMPPCGTGDSEILLDEQEYINLIKNSVNIIPDFEPIPEFNPCSEELLKIHVPEITTKKGKKKAMIQEIDIV